jgi:homoserine O-acetyltransferase
MIKAKLLAVNFADDLANAVEIGVMEPALSRLATGRSVTIARTDQSFAHFNYFFPEKWKPYLIELLKPQP